MSDAGKVYFIMGSIAMIIFITQVGALMGQSLITNAPNPPTVIGTPDPNILNYLGFVFANFGYFIQLTTISSGFFIMGFLLIIWSIGIIWAIVELARGV